MLYIPIQTKQDPVLTVNTAPATITVFRCSCNIRLRHDLSPFAFRSRSADFELLREWLLGLASGGDAWSMVLKVGGFE